MGLIGAGMMNFRGDGPWRGMTTLSRASPHEFELLENCYVSSDGSELRMMPGYYTMIDPATATRSTTSASQTDGYIADAVDARRPVASDLSIQYSVHTNPTESMKVWTRPQNLFCFEQVRGRWIIVGESTYRREPIYNAGLTAYVAVTAVTWVSTAPDVTRLTLSENVSSTFDLFNRVNAPGVGPPALPGSQINISGLSNSGAGPILNDKVWAVVAVGANTIDITANIINAGNNLAGQNAYVDRVTDTSTVGATSDDVVSLTTWTSLAAGDVEANPSQRVYQAFVANRQRDFGDAAGIAATDPPIHLRPGNSFVNIPRSRRRQKTLPFRPVPAIAGDRLLLAAPGYNCVLQAPAYVPINYDESTDSLGIDAIANDIYDKPRMLGVPKAVVWEDPDKAVATSWHIYDAPDLARSFGGTGGGAGRAGVYKFRFGYKDETTGEVGLLSEEVSITTNAATYVHQGIRFLVQFPGYMMPESLALTINVYRTQLNTDTYYFDRSIRLTAWTNGGTVGSSVSAKYGVFPNSASGTYDHMVIYQAQYIADADLAKHDQVIPTLEQYPRGCKTIRSIRGWTMFGGAMGDAGSRLELLKGTLSIDYSTAAEVQHPNANELYARGYNGSYQTLDTGFGGSLHGIPSSYEQQCILSRTLFPAWTRQLVRLGKVLNVRSNYNNGLLYPSSYGDTTQQRWSIIDSMLIDGVTLTGGPREGHDCYIKLPRGVVQLSEQDFPWVTPAPNTLVVSDDHDEDVEAIGDNNGQAVICTRNRTYMLGWTSSPIGIPPELAADRFGCIAPNTMVSFDGGCAWISDRGPCAMIGGSFQWIGQPLSTWFVGETSRYQRDSLGMMRHAWACHDPGRGLIYFGLYINRDVTLTVTHGGVTAEWASATDEAKSRFPCDEVLVYSYRVGAWSVWKPLPGMEVLWMANGQDADGHSRVFFLAADKRIYAFDDTYSHFNREPTKTTVASASTGATINITTAIGQSVADRGAGSYVQNGLPVVVVRSDDKTAVAVSTVVSFTSSSVTLADSVTVAAGDFVHIGVRSARIVTNYQNPKGTEASFLGSAAMRYNLWTRLQAGLNGLPQLAHAKVVGTSSQRVDSVDSGDSSVSVTMTHGDDSADYAYMGLGLTTNEPQERAFKRAKTRGQNHRLDVTLAGGAQVRIHDIYAEAQ